MQDFPTYSKTYITHKVSNHWSHESWLKLATKKKIKKWDYSAFPKLGLKIIKWCFDLLWKIKVPFNRIQCQYTHLSFIYTYSLLFIYLQLLLPQGVLSFWKILWTITSKSDYSILFILFIILIIISLILIKIRKV